MKSAKVLEMLNSGHIEELKAMLEDEIYIDSLKNKPSVKKRYTAMKKYFTYVTSAREVFNKPCTVEFEGVNYISFCNSYSLALTTEDCGEISMFNTSIGVYPDVCRLINYNGEKRTVDFSKIFAEAKSKGYKLKKSEVVNNKYLLHFNGAYFRIGLLDVTFGIIDDGKEATVYRSKDGIKPITIKTNIGICVVMPVRYEIEPNSVIIEVQ